MLLRSFCRPRALLSLLITLSPGLVQAANPVPPPTSPPPPPPTNEGPLPAGQDGFWELSGNLVTHDPTIIKEGNTWYEMQTGPGIGGKYSHDGLYWDPLPPVFLRPLDWWSRYVPDNRNNDVWAPELKAFNGRVWLYYSISTFGSKNSLIGLASAPSVGSGQWRDDGLVIRTTSADNYNAIDPDLVIDASGNPWLALGSWNSGIKITRLDRSTMKPTGRLYSIASRPNGIEAPTVVYRNGYYYLFVSIGKCCAGVDSTYQVVYGRSRNITGPYLDRNGTDMMRGGGSVLDRGNDRWVGPGGQDIYGTNVIVRHAYDATDNGTPKMLINTLHWDTAGWPRY